MGDFFLPTIWTLNSSDNWKESLWSWSKTQLNMNSKMGQSWLTLRFVVLGHLFSFWGFFYCGNSDFGSILQRVVTEHEDDWTQPSSRETTEVPPLGKKPSQTSCRAWRLRARTWATLASGLSLHCTHLMSALTSRRKKSFSKDSRLLEYLLVHKGRFVGTDEDLRSRWQNVRHYGFSSGIHLLVFAMCSWLSGFSFSVPEFSPLSTAKRKRFCDKNKTIPATALFLR